MLYKYLHLFNGVCASHTSATNMGTDWRDNDPVVEPMVEIYQGCRQNYERPGAPRCPTEDDAIGGWEPKGFINLALLKGYKFSFESSSDHGSTHISYAMVYAKSTTRARLLKPRCGCGTLTPPRTTSSPTGAAPQGAKTYGGRRNEEPKIIIKDDVEMNVTKPNKAEVELTWTDSKPTEGKTSYYYVRGEQTDGELVWVSPMWVTYEPGK